MKQGLLGNNGFKGSRLKTSFDMPRKQKKKMETNQNLGLRKREIIRLGKLTSKFGLLGAGFWGGERRDWREEEERELII